MTVPSPPKISFIVATHNNQNTIDECLKSIFELNYPKESIEVLVMDGCSKDDTIKIAQKYPVKIVSEPLNAPAAYNHAMNLVSYDIIGFIDSDAKVEKEWLNKIIPYLDDPQTVGVGGGIETWNMDNLWARSIGYDMKFRYHRLGKFVNRIATMNLLLRKKIIEEFGGFDEKLPSQYDTDLGVKITSKGYKIAYVPEAKCYHYNRPTIHSFFKQQLQYGTNTVKLYFKHHNLAKGDKITGIGMNIQPFLILSIFFFFLAGIPQILRPLWVVSAALLAADFIYFLTSAAGLARMFKDNTAMIMVILYFVRSFAWLFGATIFVFNAIIDGRR
jgi:cellulose synthase/poly-beta-1,6-N-acetylglucosamine synthase-like glycosyltransferase